MDCIMRAAEAKRQENYNGPSENRIVEAHYWLSMEWLLVFSY